MLGFLLGELKRSFSMVINADITPKLKMMAVKPEIHVSTFKHGISKLLT